MRFNPLNNQQLFYAQYTSVKGKKGFVFLLTICNIAFIIDGTRKRLKLSTARIRK